MILSILLSLIIWGFIFYMLWWGLGKITLADPFDKIAQGILVIGTIVVILGLILGFVHPFQIVSGINIR